MVQPTKIMKTLKCIDYQQGKILVDEQAEIKEGDWVWYHHPKQDLDMSSVHKVINPNHSLHEPSHRVHFDTGFGVIEGCLKIIAQTSNLNLKGVPFIELEEDVERLFEEHGISKQDERSKLLFLKGYKAAQPKKYTEDDLRKAIAEARMSGQGLSKLTDNEIIKSLQPKIESVEVETTQENLGEVFNGRSSHIMWGDIKPITYQKDGRTFLRVTKINYSNTNDVGTTYTMQATDIDKIIRFTNSPPKTD
jgi:hypothetical protein